MVSLLALARVAGVSRQTARTCVRKGLIGPGPYTMKDALILKVGATCLGYQTANGVTWETQTRTALTLTRGFLSQASHPKDCFLALSVDKACLVSGPDELWNLLAETHEDTLLVPLSQWLLDLAARQA